MDAKSILTLLGLVIPAFLFIFSIYNQNDQGIIVWLIVIIAVMVITILSGGLPKKKTTKKKNNMLKTAKPHKKSLNAVMTQKIKQTTPFAQILAAFQANILKIKPMTGRHIDEYTINAQITVPYTITSVIIWGLAAILGITLSPFYAALAVAPFLLPLLPKIYYSMEISGRASNVDKDLPFFLQFVETLNFVNIMLPAALDMIRKSEIFVGIRADAQLLKYMVSRGRFDEMSALFQISETHPHEKFSKFLKMYTSMIGTDREVLNNHIKDAAGQSYVDLEHQITSKRATVGPLFMMMSGAAFVAPIFLIILLKFPTVPAELLLLMINIMPIGMFLVVVMIVSVKVFTGDILEIKKVMLLAGIPAAIVSYVVTQDIYVSAGIGVAASAFANYYIVRKTDKLISNIESDITSALNIIGEKIRTKVDPVLVIKDLIHDPSFSQEFRNVAKKILNDLKTSTKPIDALQNNKHPSYMMRMTMFVLYAVLSSGSVNAAALHNFTEMMKNAIDSKTKFRNGMMTNSIAMLASPVSIVVTFALIGSLLPDISTLGDIPGLEISDAVPNEVIADALKPAVLLFGICSGMAVSISGLFSIKRTLPIGLGALTSVVTLLTWDQVVIILEGIF